MEEAGELVQQLSAATLAPLARKASGREDLHLDKWQVQALSGGLELGSELQRISGVGEAGGESIPWILVVKNIRGGKGIADGPQAAHYWKREANYYQSGLLEDLPGGLRAPRCYACYEQTGRFQLFLEDLQDANPSSNWPVGYYRSAARCLGRFNGSD